MIVTEIKQKMQNGDILTVAKMLNISRANASMALARPDSKYHYAVLVALNSVIKTREKLIKNYQQQ